MKQISMDIIVRAFNFTRTTASFAPLRTATFIRTTACALVLTQILALALTLLFAGCSREEDPVIGVKIYEYNKDFGRLVEQWKELSVNTAFVSAGLAVDPEFRESVKKENIGVFVISPVFYNPQALQEDSSLYAITSEGRRAVDSWVEFVCPSREEYRERRKNEIVKFVRDHSPDGVSIDFIRHFVFWEMIYPDRDPTTIERSCYCNHCLRSFLETIGGRMPSDLVATVDKARYIDSNYGQQWNIWRTGLITSMVRDISQGVREVDPSITIVVHALPWRDSDFDGAIIRIGGQDLMELARHADYIKPMLYSQMLRREPGWISDVVVELDGRIPGKILPSIQVDVAYIDDQFTPGDFRQCVIESLREPSRGVVYWNWDALENDPDRFRSAILKRKP